MFIFRVLAMFSLDYPTIYTQLLFFAINIVFLKQALSNVKIM